MKKLASSLRDGAFLICMLGFFAVSALADANFNATSGPSRAQPLVPNGSADLSLMSVAAVTAPLSSVVALPGTLAITTQDTSSPATAAFFPIIGLIVAISATQLLRRRRIAQRRSSSPGGL